MFCLFILQRVFQLELSKMHKQSQAKCKSLSQAKAITASVSGDRLTAHPLTLRVGVCTRGCVHTGANVHGCACSPVCVYSRRRCVLTTHAYVQHVRVSRHVENHTHIR